MNPLSSEAPRAAGLFQKSSSTSELPSAHPHCRTAASRHMLKLKPDFNFSAT
jgi:hypothetical protein